ncbi:hypothetical protein [Pseudonocardia alaniniphila]|uniref:Uncharacterized protein n=1 Tax=Pseudonocardia alaniniphila TaxID=75291 RepID=A0ABS9TUS8_9PSEU|nr:hypothetical protein [Pseudonocardia alaniniphila]MCH6172319.1 hypothetical protein [Pseudonocardia alaniniphila]
MQIHEFSGEEIEDAGREVFMPVIVRTRPGFHSRIASQELGEAIKLSRAY